MVVLLRYIGGGTDDISIVKMYENSYGELLEGENDFRSFAALNTYHMVKSEFLLEDEIFSLSDYDMNHIMVELI